MRTQLASTLLPLNRMKRTSRQDGRLTERGNEWTHN